MPARLGAMDFEQRYQAVSTRDARFDGAFVLAVRTTGIYCRPSCPARTPNPANVEFFATVAAAHESGYRACKRCLPDAVAGSADWNLRSDAAARAMRLIADGVVEREGVPGLASRLGYTSRHLTRLLTAELGAGPLALARAHRAQTARQLLIGTDLPMAEVAFAAGFGSIRQFNDTIAAVYGLSPSGLRASRRKPSWPAGTDHPGWTTVSLQLPVRAPFDADGVFAWLRVRAIRGVEDASTTHYQRTVQLPGGPAWFRVDRLADGLRLQAGLTHLGDLNSLVFRVRRLLDADADPVGIDQALSQQAGLAGSVTATPGIRLTGTVDPNEMLVRAVIGQQISVAAARTHASRLAEHLGEPVAGAPTGLERLFPTPLAIAERGRDQLSGPRTRVENLVRMAGRLASGELTLSYSDDWADQRERLLAEAGIGTWTAAYLAMRVLGHPDVLPVGDVAVRTGARRLGLPDSPTALGTWGRSVSPWRSYASLHLWRAASLPTPKENP
jgi:AraC family transcriptional regulator, regulatory protein of adaptative response / DNA-3-methyladenine glycosylase II